MRRFLVLLKKELIELLTPQIFVPFVITIAVFGLIGNLAGDESDRAAMKRLAVADRDRSAASESLLAAARKAGFKVVAVSGSSPDEALRSARAQKLSLLLFIPNGFEKQLASNRQARLSLTTVVSDFSMSSAQNSQELKGLVEALNESARMNFVTANAPEVSVEAALRPIVLEETVVVGDRSARVPVEQVMGFVSTQTMFIPIILFIVLAFASQMIATAVASEKENKTLETLLSMPVDRKAIVGSKMVAAGLVALLGALFYLVGFRYYLNSISGGEFANAASKAGAFVKQLGLVFTVPQYALLGASLFLGILCALAISIILGAFAEDVKSVSVAVTPIMLLVMIPYFLTMFVGIEKLPVAARYLIYAIPFSHPFLASPNLFLHNWNAVVYGILYQAVFFLAALSAAARIFSSDRILTIKLKAPRRGGGARAF
jgi:ABC-2 type transport system permease protein